MELIEHHQQQVLEAFRRGEFDQIEIIGHADEKEFFELCLKEKMLEALAKEMPTARKKEEVPLWFQLAANLSLKLHLENAYSAFERVVRCGGLLSALDPSIASKHLDNESQKWVLQCQGFNDKNHYDRTTPCHHDTLRKAVKDVEAKRWMDWFNGAVQEIFQSYGFFDPAGIFIGDGSYLFVPDIRETYGDGHQDKWALMDTRSTIRDPVKPKEQYGLRVVIEERHRILKCFHDLSDFSSRCFNVIAAQVVFILLSYTLRQWQLWKIQQEKLAGKTPGFLERELSAHSQFVVIYHEHAYAQLPLVSFTRELLELAAEAQAKALTKVRRLEQSLLSPLPHLRAPVLTG